MFSFGFFYAGNRGRTGTEYYLRRILSPVRLPISPLRQVNWRHHPDSNWSIKVLQTLALPLGYGAKNYCFYASEPFWFNCGAEDGI